MRRLTKARWFPFILLGGVALVALVGLVLAQASEMTADSPRWELWRLCLQILGVSLVGAVVGHATFRLQQTQIQARQDADRARDQRERVNERVRSLIGETLASYNSVKRVRRLLEAEAGPREDARVDVATYSALMSQLCKQQLVFESLRRRAPLIQVHVASCQKIKVDVGGGRDLEESLEQHYGHIERYLNDLIQEYQQRLHRVRGESVVPLDRVDDGGLASFIYDTPIFKSNVSHRAVGVVKALELHLLTPQPICPDDRNAPQLPEGRSLSRLSESNR